MDQATIERILARQGAGNTPENVNRIIQMAASDPSILERYSLGTAPAQISSGPGRQDIRGGGGMDDNAALLNLNKSIDQSIAKTDLPPPPTNGAPPPVANGGPRRAAPPPPRRGASAVVDPSLDPNVNMPAPAPQAALPSDPVTVGMTGQTFGGDRRDPSTGAAPPPGGMDWIIPSLLALFGAGGSAAALARRGPGNTGAPPTPNTPQLPGPLPPSRQIEGPRAQITGPPDNSGAPPSAPARAKGAPMAPGPGQTPDDVARMQAEVDAENRQAQALQEQMKQREKAKANTAETVRRAKGATGRRP